MNAQAIINWSHMTACGHVLKIFVSSAVVLLTCLTPSVAQPESTSEHGQNNSAAIVGTTFVYCPLSVTRSKTKIGNYALGTLDDGNSSIERRWTVASDTETEVYVAWRIPPVSDVDKFFFALFAEILAGISDSRLSHHLVNTLGCSNNVNMQLEESEGIEADLLVIRADVAEGHSVDEVEGVIKDVIQQAMKNGLTTLEIDRAVRRMEIKQAVHLACKCSAVVNCPLPIIHSNMQLGLDAVMEVLRPIFLPERAYSLLIERDQIRFPITTEYADLVSRLTKMLDSRTVDAVKREKVIKDTLRQFGLMPAEMRQDLFVLLGKGSGEEKNSIACFATDSDEWRVASNEKSCTMHNTQCTIDDDDDKLWNSAAVTDGSSLALQSFHLLNGLELRARHIANTGIVRARLVLTLDSDAPEGTAWLMSNVLPSLGSGGMDWAAFQSHKDLSGVLSQINAGDGWIAWNLVATPANADMMIQILADEALRPSWSIADELPHIIRRTLLERGTKGKVREGQLRSMNAENIDQNRFITLWQYVRRPQRAVLTVFGEVETISLRRAVWQHFGPWEGFVNTQ